MTSPEQVLARARAAMGHGTLYWIGTGGNDPSAALPATPLPVGRLWPTLDAAKRLELAPQAEAAGIDVDDPTLVLHACDCSGFVCWALGFARQSPGGGWINTDSIWADATGPQRRFQRLDRARPGALLVHPTAIGEKYGHVAIVMEADTHGRATLIAHCSAANFLEAPHDAMKITTPEVFDPYKASNVYAWCRDVV